MRRASQFFRRHDENDPPGPEPLDLGDQRKHVAEAGIAMRVDAHEKAGIGFEPNGQIRQCRVALQFFAVEREAAVGGDR